jgi:hypothetical protein
LLGGDGWVEWKGDDNDDDFITTVRPFDE